MGLTFIGDVHGHYLDYMETIRNYEHSIQLGDYGFDWLTLKTVDPDNHKVLAGNHDNYDEAPTMPHYLGDFGQITHGGIELFFVRGGFSIDRRMRIEGRSWWRAEELETAEMCNAIELYNDVKPDLVISHECPADVVTKVVRSTKLFPPSNTAQLLAAMLCIHKPKLWIFGHHHNSKVFGHKGTEFRCLAELETFTLD